MSGKLEELLHTYKQYESNLPLRWMADSDDLGALVTFANNRHSPVDRWFHFKEGFCSQLLGYVRAHLPLDRSRIDRILDPFAGVGTTLLAAQRARDTGWTCEAFGVECNPFIQFVANTKLTWHLLDVDRLAQLEKEILSPPLSECEYRGNIPELTTIRNPRVFPRGDLLRLLALRERIRNRASIYPRERDFLLLGFAAVLEEVSGVRKDGRALRFVERDRQPGIKNAVAQQWRRMRRDLTQLNEIVELNNARVCLGDARDLAALGLQEDSFDLIVYSPPYLNNIDYTEVYKLEAWMLEFITSYEGFRAQREKTLRSHPSIRFDPTDWLDRTDNASTARALRDALNDAWPKEGRKWRTRLVSGYVDDMLRCLREQYRVAKRGGYAVCVVGNSLHLRTPYRVPVAADLLIAALAQSVGFKIEQIQAIRHLHRRDGQRRHFLRESILFMSKPRNPMPSPTKDRLS